MVFIDCRIVHSSKKHKAVRNCMMRRQRQLTQVTCTAMIGKPWHITGRVLHSVKDFVQIAHILKEGQKKWLVAGLSKLIIIQLAE